MAQSFFQAIGVNSDSDSIRKLSIDSGVSVESLRHYQKSHVLPDIFTFNKLSNTLQLEYHRVALKMGVVTRQLQIWLAKNSDLLEIPLPPTGDAIELPYPPTLTTDKGTLYQNDCMEVLPALKSESVDLVFADPPFNLEKAYNVHSTDDMDTNEYRMWCYEWLDECIRVLKPGGSLFIWNIPHHNQDISQYISQFLTFRHWIAVQMSYGFGIRGRLYPAHYSLLYFVKGRKPNVFRPDRLPLDTCRKCSHELKDYGGYKHKLNPEGINLKDIWLDIHPVRHKRLKNRQHNELPLSLLDRVIEMSSEPNQTILDPFMGSGTTAIVAELKNRQWIGSEIGEVQTIANRINNLDVEEKSLDKYRSQLNKLFPQEIRKARVKNKLWVDENV